MATHSGTSCTSLRIAVVGLLACVLGFSAPAAKADLSPVFFEVQATSAAGTGTYTVYTEDVTPTGSTWTWFGFGIPLTDGDNTIAFVEMAVVNIMEDPLVAVTFAITAGEYDTTVSVSTATVGFPTINNAIGSASVGVTLTEADGNTATLTGNGPNGLVYLTEYNGGTTFAEFIDQVYEPVAYGSEDASADTGGFVPIVDPVSSVAGHLDFVVTANDSASSTSNFVVMPEPASIMLLVLGVVALRRR